jgi:cell division protein FtsL
MAEFVSKTLALGQAGAVREASLPAREINRSLVVVTITMAAVFIACALFSVWAHHQVVSLGYEISEANQEEQDLLQESKKLRLEVASLKSPGRIQGTALRDLGFTNPQKDQLIIVR